MESGPNPLLPCISLTSDKRTKVKLCRTREELERSVVKATFKCSKIIDPKLVGVEMRYSSMILNKPY